MNYKLPKIFFPAATARRDLPSKEDPAMMLTNVLKGQEFVEEYAFVWLDITNVNITFTSI